MNRLVQLISQDSPPILLLAIFDQSSNTGNTPKFYVGHTGVLYSAVLG
jgi:hypothetical protein